MKKHLSILLFMTLALVSVGCNGDDPGTRTEPNGAEGEIKLTLKNSAELIVSTKSTDTTPITLEDFMVVIKQSADGAIVEQWTYGEMPTTVVLDEGDYTLEAYNTQPSPAAFDEPAYYGSKDITVVAQTLKTVEIACEIINVKVSVELSDKFKEKISQYSVSVVNNEGMGTLIWDASNIDASGWFAVPASSGQLVVAVKGTITQSGESINSSFTINDVVARQWHKLFIDIATSGSTSTTISVSSDLVDKELDLNIPDGDDVIGNNGDQGSWEDEDPGTEPEEPTEPTLPTITGSNLNGAAFDIKQPVNLSKAAVSAEGATTVLDILFESTATGGISGLLLEITSDDEIISGIFTTSYDLCTLSEGSVYNLLVDTAIIDPNNPIAGKSSHTFSVGGLMGMLAELGAGKTHNFKVTVIDANGQASETLVINIVD